MQRLNLMQSDSDQQNNHLSQLADLSDDQLIGRLVVEVLEAGKSLNRKAICNKLLSWIELAPSDELLKRFQHLLRVILEKDQYQ